MTLVAFAKRLFEGPRDKPDVYLTVKTSCNLIQSYHIEQSYLTMYILNWVEYGFVKHHLLMIDSGSITIIH